MAISDTLKLRPGAGALRQMAPRRLLDDERSLAVLLLLPTAVLLGLFIAGSAPLPVGERSAAAGRRVRGSRPFGTNPRFPSPSLRPSPQKGSGSQNAKCDRPVLVRERARE
jgi:hypothetical protein